MESRDFDVKGAMMKIKVHGCYGRQIKKIKVLKHKDPIKYKLEGLRLYYFLRNEIPATTYAVVQELMKADVAIEMTEEELKGWTVR